MKRFLLFLFFALLLFGDLSAQSREPVQISGVVITADSVPQFIPYAHVMVEARRRGTMTGKDGFFSFAAMPGDTIVVSCIGFKRERLLIPDTLNDQDYLARIVMLRDTTLLEEVTLYPWPRPEDFQREFLATNVPATDEDIALRNLAIQELKERAAAAGYDATEIQDYAIMMQNQSIYNYGSDQIYSDGGTAILGRLSDPFAWGRFFRSLSRNDDD